MAPGLQYRLDIEALAVIYNAKDGRPILPTQKYADVERLGVPGHVGQGFLSDAVEGDLLLRDQPLVVQVASVERHPDAVYALVVVGIAFKGWNEA